MPLRLPRVAWCSSELDRILGISAQTSFRDVSTCDSAAVFAGIWVYERVQRRLTGDKDRTSIERLMHQFREPVI